MKRLVKLYTNALLAVTQLLHFCRTRLVKVRVSAVENGHYIKTDFWTDFREYTRDHLKHDFKRRLTQNLGSTEGGQDPRKQHPAVMILPLVAIVVAILLLVWAMP